MIKYLVVSHIRFIITALCCANYQYLQIKSIRHPVDYDSSIVAGKYCSDIDRCKLLVFTHEGKSRVRPCTVYAGRLKIINKTLIQLLGIISKLSRHQQCIFIIQILNISSSVIQEDTEHDRTHFDSISPMYKCM